MSKKVVISLRSGRADLTVRPIASVSLGDDALKRNETRSALKRRDIAAAARHGEVSELTKLA